MQNDIFTPKADKRLQASQADKPLNSSTFTRSNEAKKTVSLPKNSQQQTGNKQRTIGKKRELLHKLHPSKLNLCNQICLLRWKQLSQKQRLVSLTAMGILLIIGTLGAMELFIKDPSPVAPAITAKRPALTTGPSPLTGVKVPLELAALPVTGVIIENSPDARPQAGLQEAGIVFEAVSEGGITRFLALYQEAKPTYIGPVRSVRPYYLDWLLSFDAAIAHAGGSGPALAKIRTLGIKNIDHGANADAFSRVNNRFAPHNLYTSRDKLLEVHNTRGYTTSTFKGFDRKKRETPAQAPTVNTIALNISSANYNSVFNYDKATNSYLRTMAGRPHTDEKSGKQISPKVVIALITDRGQSGIHSVYRTTGRGTALIFQDGGFTQATWQKTDIKSPLEFLNDTGKPVSLNPGQTWITVLTSMGQAVYGP